MNKVYSTYLVSEGYDISITPLGIYKAFKEARFSLVSEYPNETMYVELDIKDILNKQSNHPCSTYVVLVITELH